MIHDVRVIPVDGSQHLPEDIRQWHGDSRGHYEGDTLIIETTNFDKEGAFRGATAGLQITERLTRVGPDTVHYEFTVNVRDMDTALDSDVSNGQNRTTPV